MSIKYLGFSSRLDTRVLDPGPCIRQRLGKRELLPPELSDGNFAQTEEFQKDSHITADPEEEFHITVFSSLIPQENS